MAQRIFCTDCGQELSDSQREQLRSGDIVYCMECGKAFKAEKPSAPPKKQAGLGGGLKKFGDKLGKEIKKTSEKIETKIKEKKQEPQAQPTSGQSYDAPPSKQTPPYYTRQAPEPEYEAPKSSYQNTKKHSNYGTGILGKLKQAYSRMQALTPEELEERNLRMQAERNVIARQFITMHFLTYILINAMLFGINFFTNPNNYWSLWAVTGWGLLLVIHAFRYTDSRQSAPFGFFPTSLFYYLVINAYLLFIDTFDGKTFTDGIDFVIDVAVLWGGILLVLYIYNFYWKSESVKRQMAESKKPDLLKTPVVVSHLIAYVIFNLISFLVDYFIPMSVKWYYWTIFGWGIFILLHIFASALFGVLNLSFSSGLLLAHTLAYVSVGALLILMDTFSGTGFSDPITNFSIYPIVFWSVIYVGHFLVIIYWNSESIRKQMAESTKPFHLKGPMVAFHFITYVVFNIIAYLSVTFILKGELWYYWTIFGWGIFVLLHALSSAIYGAFNLTVSSGLLLAHTIAFVSVSSLLILINAYSGTGFTDPITWALFPVVFWAVFYILHFIVYIIWLRRPTQADVEKEVERLRSQKK